MNVAATLGASALLTALAASVVATAASVAGHRLRSRVLLLAGRRAIAAAALLTSMATVTLAYALLTNDFSIAHVASVSSRNMQVAMKWASLYSGQPGSMLFWTWTMSLFMAAFTAMSSTVAAPRNNWCCSAKHCIAPEPTCMCAL